MTAFSESKKSVILGSLLSLISLATAACGDRDIASLSTTPPPPQTSTASISSSSSAGDRVELLFQDELGIVNLSDAAIALALFNLPSEDSPTLTTAATTLFGATVETPEIAPSSDDIDDFAEPSDGVTLADIAVVVAASTLAREERTAEDLLPLTNNLLGPQSIDRVLQVPGEGSAPLPGGEVPSTIGGTGSVISEPGGALETAQDIDALLDSVPEEFRLPRPPVGDQPSFTRTASIRLPNGSPGPEEDFYVAVVTQRPSGATTGLDLNEPVGDVCTPSPVPAGGTCEFEDIFPVFPDIPFTLEFTFTDGAGIQYTSARDVIFLFED